MPAATYSAPASSLRPASICPTDPPGGRRCKPANSRSGSIILASSPMSRYCPEHLSVYQTFPELWEREAFEEQLDGAPEATGEPGKFSAGELGRLTVRVFFSAGAGLLAWSHMPVETAQ